MELCDSCKQKHCNKNIVVTNDKKIKTIKCLDYVKDINKIKGYKKILEVTAKRDYIKEVEK